MKTKSLLVLGIIIIVHLSVKAQVKIGTNPTSINGASLLELESSNQGFVLPRVSIGNVSASSPLVSGLLTGTVVYNTNSSTTGGSGTGIYLWDGTKWVFISTGSAVSSSAWLLTGNSGTSYATNFLGTTDNISMRFRTNNVQRMIIDSLGKVGIGIGNPAYALSVLSASNPLYLSGVQATTTFIADSILTINGGVVKKTPSSAIAGNNWLLTGNAGTNSAINFLGTTDNHPLKFKVNNSIAGFIDSSGGLGNTYFGSIAGYSNTTGNGNTFIGGGTDSANSSGTSNTALGYQAGYNNTSGGSNLFTGYQSGYSNTTSSGNVFSGFQAGYRNTTGQLNLFSGYWTGYSNTTGSNNVFTGYLSGFGNTTGGNNIFIGSQAGSTNTTGSRNTLIGGNSNVLSAGLANASAMGYGAKVGLSNSLVLGDTISGGNAVNVGIGVRYPLKRLHIDAAPISIFAVGTQDSLKIDNLASSSSAYNKAILVIDSATGYVSKQNLSNLSSNINWSLTGNSGTNSATNFLGTTDSASMRFRTANTQRMIIDSLGHVGIGSSSFDPFNPGKLLVDYGVTSSNTMANFKGSVDDYFQINLQNKSSTGNASTDYVATADDGTDSTYYIDMGINSSNYAFSIDNWGQAHDAYLYSNSKNLYIGTQASGSDVIFLVGGGRAVTNAALRIRGNTGNIVVGKGDLSSTPIGNVLRGPNGYGTNIAGGNLTVQGGAGTGTAGAGNLSLNGGITGTGANGIINLSTSSTERMRIDASGNVGIGTINPSNLLSVIAASNPLYLSGVQATSTFTSDSILTINAGVVKKTPYSSFPSATTNTLTLSTNTLTSTVNGVAATSAAVSGVNNSSSTNTLSTTVNGLTGAAVPIINTNTNALTQAGGLVTTVNGVAATTLIPANTISNVLGYNASGAPVYQSASGILSGATTNTLALSGNSLTSTVNGVAATSAAVSSVSNISSANNLSTTINGVAGTTVPIINTNTNAFTQSGGLVTTVNGVTATTSIASGTVSNILGYNTSGTPVYQTLNNINLSSAWNIVGNSGTTAGTNYIGTTDNIDFVTKTNGIERMRVLANGRVGIGVTNPSEPLTVKDTMEIRRVGSLSSLLFTNTSGTGDFRIGGDGGDIFWQGGGGRALQMGSYWTTIIGGDRQTSVYPAFVNSLTGTSVLVQGQRDVSVPLGIQGNSASQSANLTEWRNSSGTVLSSVNKNGYLGIGTSSSSYSLSVLAVSNPLYLSGVQGTSTFTTDSILTINAGVVKKAAYSALTGATTNTLTLSTNTLTSTVNGVAATSDAVSGVSNTSSANTLSTAVNGVAGTTVPIINTNTNALTQAGGLVNTVNGVTATTSIASGTVSNILGYNTAGTPVYQPLSNINLSSAWNILGNSGTNASNNFIGTTDGNDFVTRTNNIERVRVTSAGSVGIGVTNPQQALSIGNGMSIDQNDANNGVVNANALTFGSNSGEGIASKRTLNGNHWGLDFYTNGYNRMSITNGGFMGVGTTNPSNVLTVLGANPLYLGGVQATGSLTSDSILTINAGVVKKIAYSSFSGATTNTLSLSTNTLTSTVNGVAVTSNAVSGVSNTSNTNTLSTTVNGVTSTTVPIINTNANALTQAGGLVNTVNGVAATTSIPTGIVSNILGYNASGAPVYQSASGILSGTTTNTITLSGNTLTSTVNGIAATSNSVSSVSNTSSANTLSTTINGVAGITAPIINTNTNALTQAGGLVNTVNGVAATTAIASGTITNILGYNTSGTAVYQPLSNLNVTSAWNITGNSGISGSNFLGTTDNVSMRIRTNNVQRMIIDSLGKVGIGISIPISDLTLYQSSGSAGNSKGFTFTGNSISGVSSGTGVLMTLGYNAAGNKQLWFGDGDYAGNASGSFARFVANSTNFPTFDAVSGDGASRRYLALGVAGDANSGVIFGTDNTGTNPGSLVWDNGNISIGSGYKSYAAPSNGLLVQGNVGIGTTSPLSALSVIASSNPMYMSGLTALTSFSSTDSVLTISSGTVKKAPYTLLSGSGSASSGWALAGNSIASGQFLGTTNAQALVLKANNVQMGYFDGNISSLTLGVGAINNSSDHNVAIGYNASTNNQYALALGYNASATGVRSVAIGNGGSATTASGSEAVAIGYNANANNVQTVAMGYQAQATGQYGLALGYNPTASGIQSVAIGYQAQATQQYSSALGYQAQATGSSSTAIGYLAQTSQSNTILLGNISTNNLYVGIGTSAPSAKLDIVANSGFNPLELHGLPTGTAGTDNILTVNSSGVVGYVTPSTFNANYWSLNGNAATSGSYLGTTNSTPLQFKFNSTNAGYLDANNTSLGTSATSTSGTSNTAIGYSANAANSATAVGASSVAANAANTAIGNNATANNSDHETAIGASAQANAQYNTAVGYNAQAVNNAQATAIGTTATANGYQSTALGYGAQAINNAQTTALGATATANAQYNTAVGYAAQAISNSQGTAVGYNSKSTSQYGVALGYNAQAINNSQTTAVGSSTVASGATSSAFGYDANATAAQTTSIGGESDATVQSNTAVGYNAQATNNTQATAIGAGTSATGSNSTVVGYGATTSQANALILGNSSVNVGIGTSTPNTSAKLDVAGTFKLGSTGTVLNSMIKGTATATIGFIGIGGTSSTTFTVPNATVGAIVSVSPKAALPYSVVIGYAYVSAANTVTITFGVGGTATTGFTTTLDVAIIQ